MLGTEEEELALRISAAIDEGIAGNCDRAVEMACQGVLAKFLWWADHHDESIALYEQTLAACERALGPDDAITNEVAAGLEEVREDVSGDDAS
jgi:hypothetical protein